MKNELQTAILAASLSLAAPGCDPGPRTKEEIIAEKSGEEEVRSYQNGITTYEEYCAALLRHQTGLDDELGRKVERDGLLEKTAEKVRDRLHRNGFRLKGDLECEPEEPADKDLLIYE